MDFFYFDVDLKIFDLTLHVVISFWKKSHFYSQVLILIDISQSFLTEKAFSNEIVSSMVLLQYLSQVLNSILIKERSFLSKVFEKNQMITHYIG